MNIACSDGDQHKEALTPDQRNRAVITLNIVCEALEIDTDDYERKNEKVRKWARGVIADRTRKSEKRAERQDKYFGAGKDAA